jgi:hypothetical protein
LAASGELALAGLETVTRQEAVTISADPTTLKDLSTLMSWLPFPARIKRAPSMRVRSPAHKSPVIVR